MGQPNCRRHSGGVAQDRAPVTRKGRGRKALSRRRTQASANPDLSQVNSARVDLGLFSEAGMSWVRVPPWPPHGRVAQLVEQTYYGP